MGCSRLIALATAFACALVTSPATHAAPTRPSLVLWAWERPEDLSFLAGSSVGVAFLSRTVHLRGDAMHVVPRRQPLRVPPSVALTAVVRIESARHHPVSFSSTQVASLVAEIVTAAKLPQVRDVQIDFDARASQRAAYRNLLAEVRKALPKGTGLSMTALASWCTFDNWLDTGPLPVDEVVPMVFMMGRDGPRVRSEIERVGSLPAAACRTSIGISAQSPIPKTRKPLRTWVFNAKPWDLATFTAVQGSLRKAYP